MTLTIRKIIPAHSRKPVIHAEVDGETILWDPYRGGWRCTDCGNTGDPCDHAAELVALLDPSVLGVDAAPALSCNACQRTIGQRAFHRVVGQNVLCLPCAEVPQTHSDLFPDCPYAWHNVYNHSGTNASRAAAAALLGAAS